MGNELLVQLAEDGAHAERLDALTGFLRRELLDFSPADCRARTWTHFDVGSMAAGGYERVYQSLVL